jgi:hypothetical protein
MAIGRWELQQKGKLMLVIPYQTEQPNHLHRSIPITWKLPATCDLVLTGDFHLNSFGLQPKLSRGIVVVSQNKANILQPIIATFSATGTGRDSADLSFQFRK